jgi:hypothetical protein
MILPHLDNPARFQGLYVYDFGQWTAVGYTAEEIAILLEHEEYRHGKVYKIHRTTPDGQMELRGISAQRFKLEGGMFFYRSELEPARADFEALRAAAEKTPPPCRAFVHLAERSTETGPYGYLTALIFPAEYESEIGDWLTAVAFCGGDLAEGGVSPVTNHQGEQKTILERQQLWSRPAIPSRSRDEVLASIRQVVQR